MGTREASSSARSLNNLSANSMKKLKLILALGVGTATASADLITEPTRYFEVGQDIADIQNPFATFLQTITDSSIVSLTEVEVGLQLSGVTEGTGFASEMIVVLNKNLTQTAYLLNEAGVSDEDPIGAFYDGWNVTFSDSAGEDVHSAAPQSGVLTGVWQPDGRINPSSSSRPLMLDVFQGGTGNGEWRLAVGDLQLGGQMRLQSWSIRLSGETSAASTPVPEVTSTPMLLFLGAILSMATRQKTSARSRNRPPAVSPCKVG
jgi:hypothetical protein